MFLKKPNYWVDMRTEPWSQLEIDCWYNSDNNNNSAYLAWKEIVLMQKNIALMIEKEVYRLGYGKRGKTKLSNDENILL